MSNEELMEKLRVCAGGKCNERDSDGCWTDLMYEAADAIEGLQKALDAVNDAHNEGYDVGYWAGRRDYEPKWIPVSERLPEANVDVLALYEWADQFNKEKKYTYICRASYAPKNTIRVDDKWSEVDEEWMDYWEEADSYYVPEGWYEECSQGNSDYMSYHIGATVTHWMPLPPVHNEFFESLKLGLEQVINGETRERTIEVDE